MLLHSNLHTTKPVARPPSKPTIAVSKDGDIIIIQAPEYPALFFARSQVDLLLKAPASASALAIKGISAAAVAAIVEASASFEVCAVSPARTATRSVTLRFQTSNGLIVVYTTDADLAADRARIASLGADIVATDTFLARRTPRAIDLEIVAWAPKAQFPTGSLELFDRAHLAKLVRETLALREPKTAQIIQFQK